MITSEEIHVCLIERALFFVRKVRTETGATYGRTWFYEVELQTREFILKEGRWGEVARAVENLPLHFHFLELCIVLLPSFFEGVQRRILE